ncbi:MAG: DUF192 domain-containing protein [Candidatus Roizmanbacteria bacterium]|nr:DUF192 domain-containing protein [Candidatus Roizmanbacteria bacterium]
MKKFTIITLLSLLFYTRFVGLDWGFPYPMHPDERNMAVAVEQLSCPSLSSLVTSHQSLIACLNPHFFAYGQFPLYLAYGGIQLYHLVTGQTNQPNFLEATFALRVLSTLSSVLLIYVLLLIVELIYPKKKFSTFIAQILAFCFLIFQPYAIQFAHFGTTEGLLMLFYALIIYYSLSLLTPDHHKLSTLIFLGLFSGLTLGTKTSSLLFIGTPLLVMGIKIIGGSRGRAPNTAPLPASQAQAVVGRKTTDRIYYLFQIVTYLCITSVFFIFSSPQSFLNWNDFVSSMNYESAVGLGVYVPFYTRQFVGTTPILFQFQKILPYVLGWPQLILSILGFVFLPSFIGKVIVLQMARVKGTQQRAQNFKPAGNLKVLEHWWGKLRVTESAKLTIIMFDILRFALILSFLPSSFFFAKWTRFIAPSFPLFSLFALLFLIQMLSLRKIKKEYIYGVFVISMIPGFAFLSIYLSPDVRFIASDWIYKNIPENSKILSETANVIDIPIPSPRSNEKAKNYLLNSFNFYDLDSTKQLQLDLSRALNDADYVIVPSRRIFKNHPKNSYPYLANYYDQLFSGISGFEKVAEFSSYPRVELFEKTIFSIPDEEAEETWTVFDHPVIRIYKKISKNMLLSNNLDFSDYKTTTYQALGKNYRLLIAETPEKWERGLMYVKNKADIQNLDGMMFNFSNSETRMFWNKNTLSHLTLYWVNKGKVVGTSDLPSITETGTITTVSSPSPADRVIEIMK